MRKSSLCIAIVGVILAAGAVFKFLISERRTVRSEQAQISISSAPENKTPPATKPVSTEKNPSTSVSPGVSPASRPVQKDAADAVTRSARQLVAELTELSGLHGPVTPEQAEKFKATLAELIRRGSSSVSAIREFLDKNLDTDFGQVNGGDQLSYSSLRAALFDVLRQIGGPEAQVAMLQTLQTSAVPAELLELAKNLENEAPGQYRDQILRAARETLDMAQANQLGTNVEVGPAYRMLDAYGGELDELAKTEPSLFYNAIVMANSPDGQGLQSLVQMAQSSGPGASGQSIATEMIAQLAGQNLQALDTLMRMAENGQISNRLWARLAPILGGDQYQIGTPPAAFSTSPENNPNSAPSYTMVNSATTPDQINQRIALLDRFLGLVSPNSAPAAALLHQRDLLAAKLSN
jgi:hypothetical protein